MRETINKMTLNKEEKSIIELMESLKKQTDGLSHNLARQSLKLANWDEKLAADLMKRLSGRAKDTGYKYLRLFISFSAYYLKNPYLVERWKKEA